MLRRVVFTLAFLASVVAQNSAFADPLNEPAALLAHTQFHPLYSAVHTPSGVLAAGSRGVILRKQNNEWLQVGSPVRRTLTGMTELGDGNVLVVGHDALILSGSATGNNWQVIYSDPEFDAPLFDIWVGSEGFGLSVGAYGLALATEDFGQTWEQRTIDLDEPHFNAIHQTAEGTLFIAGEFGTVLRSRDLGVNWERLDVDYDATFFGIESDTQGRLILFGIRGRVSVSSDLGDSWSHLDIDTKSSIFDAVFLEDGRAVLAGFNGTLLIESSAGSNFFQILPNFYGGTFTKILIISPDTLLLFGSGGIYTQQIPPA